MGLHSYDARQRDRLSAESGKTVRECAYVALSRAAWVLTRGEKGRERAAYGAEVGRPRASVGPDHRRQTA